MRAASLFGVLVLAKLMVLAGIGQPVGGWGAIAYFWQDMAVALLAGAVDAALRQPRLGWLFYGVLVIYIAWGVPVAIVLGTPLTWPLIGAARGPLAGSIAHYFTVINVVRIAAVVAAGIILPAVCSRIGRANVPASSRPVTWSALAAAVLFVAAGPMAVSHVETMGLERNAVTALLPSRFPGGAVARADADWRLSPFGDASVASGAPAGTRESLLRLHGAARGRNVLVVVLESTAAQYLRAYGAAEDPTPNLTALSRQAIVFDNAYATYPESIKGLFSVLCSRFPAFGIGAEEHARMPCASLANEFARGGYATGLFHSGRFGYLGMDAILERKGFNVLEDAGAIGGNVQSSFGVDESATVQRVLTWIDDQPRHAPFFAMYLPVAGHHPYATTVPGPFPDGTEYDRYRNALHEGDAALGALLDGLRARGISDQTAIVIFGDHGEAFGQHRGNVGHTLFINEENVKVPFLIAIPGLTTTPVRSAEIVSLIDVAPTLLDVAGLRPPGGYQGASALAAAHRMALFMTDYSLGLLGLRDGCWKYIYDMDAGRSKLFDVCADPGETSDRSAEERARVRMYRERVLGWSAAQRAQVTGGAR
ncbi:MAG TPA: sulfatase [Vicinamibacterales bacterium]|nr:sulfatase [Vicinamibacterales bacterium]